MILRRTIKKPFSIQSSESMGMFSVDGESVLRSKDGPLLSFDSSDRILFCKPPEKKEAHPWYTSVAWHDEVASSGSKKVCRPAGYYATIEPGFVNGLDPYIDSSIVYPTSITPPTNSGPTPPSAYSFGRKTKVGVGLRSPGLLERPRVWVNNGAFVNVAADNMGGKVSRGEFSFFSQYGFDRNQARGNFSVNSVTSTITQTINAGEASPWLGFCDIFLAIARMSSSVAKPDLGAFPITAISYSASYNDSALQTYGSRSRLMLGTIPVTPSRESQAAMIVAGQPYMDDGQDFILISRIFVLKYDVDPGSATQNLDGNELVFVKHFCFWNLQHMPKIRDPINIPAMNLGLAFLPLIGRYSIAPIATANAIESALNAALAGVMNLAGNEGKYWTT